MFEKFWFINFLSYVGGNFYVLEIWELIEVSGGGRGGLREESGNCEL